MSPILTALRKKYKTPQAVLAKLGMDASLLRAGCDDEPDTAESAKLLEILRNLTPKQIRVLRAALAKSEPDEDDEERADNDERDLGDEFEEEAEHQAPGALSTGSTQTGPQESPGPRTTASGYPKYRESDPEREAKDIRRIGIRAPARGASRLAGDAAAALDRAVPNAGRISSGAAFTFDASGPRHRAAKRTVEVSAMSKPRSTTRKLSATTPLVIMRRPRIMRIPLMPTPCMPHITLTKLQKPTRRTARRKAHSCGISSGRDNPPAARGGAPD